MKELDYSKVSDLVRVRVAINAISHIDADYFRRKILRLLRDVEESIDDSLKIEVDE